MNDRGHTNSVPWMHAVCRLCQATFIQTNCVHSWYGVGVTPVIHGTELMRFCKVALRSTKIRLTWLWPVKVTLEIIKRRLLVFCWSCDEIPLTWEEKKFPSLQFIKRDRMRLLLTPPPPRKWSVNAFKPVLRSRNISFDSDSGSVEPQIRISAAAPVPAPAIRYLENKKFWQYD